MNIIKTTENKTLNIAPEGRLDTTTAPQLEAELKQVHGFQQQYEMHRAIMKVLEKHGIHKWYGDDIPKQLEKALSRTCPEDVSSVRQSLEYAVERLKRIEEAGKKADGQQEQGGDQA